MRATWQWFVSNSFLTATKLFEFVISKNLALSRALKAYLMRGSSGIASNLNTSGSQPNRCLPLLSLPKTAEPLLYRRHCCRNIPLSSPESTVRRPSNYVDLYSYAFRYCLTEEKQKEHIY
nr:hypothetical protein [Tanacetum cinerariifolium]